jgi:membrane protease YdiL (CAAX protease family)
LSQNIILRRADCVKPQVGRFFEYSNAAKSFDLTAQIIPIIFMTDITNAPVKENLSPQENAPSADNAPVEELWDWEETRTSLHLRALFAIVAGAFLLWCQRKAGISTQNDWIGFVKFSALANLVLPLGIVWLFFAQSVRKLPMKDQRQNAWNYGWNFSDWKTHLKYAAVLFAALLPPIFWASRDESFRSYYLDYLPAPGDVSTPLMILTLVVYMFCWEWFFRGFLLFGIAQGFGAVVAIVVQAALFGAMHWGKPMAEFYSSFIGGLILGIVAWRQKSFAVAFYVHALLHIAWALLLR